MFAYPKYTEFHQFTTRLKQSSIQRNFGTYSTDLVLDMRQKFHSYKNIIENFDENGDISEIILRNKSAIKFLCDSLIDTVESFLIGDIKCAYNIFDRCLDNDIIKNCIDGLSEKLSSYSSKQKPLYRMRISNSPLSFREEIFHIPFKKRYLVQTQRYSVSGLPCLYLGSSLFICWQEMNKPDFDKVYLSACYPISHDFLILDLTYTLDEIRKSDSYLEDKLAEKAESIITLWPLIIACSYTKANLNAPFNPEYIIPNLLMQKISADSNMKQAGIAYLSTKNNGNSNRNLGFNIVLPPKINFSDMQQYDFCPNLSKKIKITTPVSWALLDTLTLPENEEKIKSSIEQNSIEDIHQTLMNNYSSSSFRKFEEKLAYYFKFGLIKNPRKITAALPM
ncbi:hypothetical protein E1B77_11050 [Salmonella enterica subsp. enterica]|nr:hypothetical protein [Salmonella enterica subsp. enterica]